MASAFKKILLIEDSQTDSFLTQRLMREYPAYTSNTIIVEESMHSAKKFLESQRDSISLILLDLGLPDTLDGYDSFEQLKEINTTNIPVIVLTSVSSIGLSTGLSKMGAEDFLCKSDILFAPLMLSKAIDFILSPAAEKQRSLRYIATEDDSSAH